MPGGDMGDVGEQNGKRNARPRTIKPADRPNLESGALNSGPKSHLDVTPRYRYASGIPAKWRSPRMSPLDDNPANNGRGVWKSGRGKGRTAPKGRQLDDAALAEVQSLMGDMPRRHDLLIEELHLILVENGHVFADHISALRDVL